MPGPAAQGLRTSPILRLFPGLVGLVVILILAQNAEEEGFITAVFSKEASGFTVADARATIACAISLLLGACLLWRSRKTILATLASVPFAVALLSAIAVATALGTFVPQNLPPGSLETWCGTAAATWIDRLFLDQTFNSLWYGGLMAVLVLSLVLAIVRRPFWRMFHWGFFLGHGGMVVIVCGAVIGAHRGMHGVLDLHKGDVRTQVVLSHNGMRTGEKMTLDFGMKLKDFDVERYPRLQLYQLQRDAEASLLRTFKVQEAGKWAPLPTTDFSLRFRYYPDIEVSEAMQTSTDAQRPPAARVRLEAGGKASEEWLVAGATGGDMLSGADVDVQLVWSDPGAEKDTSWMQRTVQARPARHGIEVVGAKARFEVKVGETYTVPGTQRSFRVVQFIPDFYYDIEKKRGASRSEQPNNPALLIEEPGAGTDGGPRTQWLFAKMPGHGQGKDSLPLKYVYFPPAPAVANLVRIAGRTKDLVLASAGKEVLRRTLEAGTPGKLELPGAAAGNAAPQSAVVTLVEVFEHAEPKLVTRTLSQEPRNPGVAVEFRHKDEDAVADEAVLVAAEKEGSMCRLPGDLVLAFEYKEVKAYRSHVAVIENGNEVKEATIAVNAPLSWGGYEFYQSDWRQEDLNFSGLKVVRDPGLSTVYAGMIMVSLGVLFVFYVRPRLRRPA
ncbi:MAG: cytochrome c biogenesis protein ResB [Planctomycetota bacterium]|nr:cytochrome c biogenesis protein ResB [Planctomycetota bacterium]